VPGTAAGAGHPLAAQPAREQPVHNAGTAVPGTMRCWYNSVAQLGGEENSPTKFHMGWRRLPAFIAVACLGLEGPFA